MRSGRRLAGRYRLDELLGRGGMGEVWRAHDLRLNRTVAVRMLPSRGTSEQAVARFRREAEIAAGLQHPGIAVVFDTGTDDGLADDDFPGPISSGGSAAAPESAPPWARSSAGSGPYPVPPSAAGSVLSPTRSSAEESGRWIKLTTGSREAPPW